MRRCDVVARVTALANGDSEENYPHYLAQAHADLHALSFSFFQRIADVPEESVKVFLEIARFDPRAFLKSIPAAL